MCVSGVTLGGCVLARLGVRNVSVLECDAVCCSMVQGVAVCCSVLQCVAVCCSVLQNAAGCCRVLQGVAGCCRVLQGAAVCCSVLQCVSCEQCVCVLTGMRAGKAGCAHRETHSHTW